MVSAPYDESACSEEQCFAPEASNGHLIEEGARNSIRLYHHNITEEEVLGKIDDHGYNIDQLLAPCDDAGFYNAWMLACTNKHWRVLQWMIDQMEPEDYEAQSSNMQNCLFGVPDMPDELATRVLAEASSATWTNADAGQGLAFLVLARFSTPHIREEMLNWAPPEVRRSLAWDEVEMFRERVLPQEPGERQLNRAMEDPIDHLDGP